MSTQKIDLLLKYILVLAAANDRGERELGPIHLIKYVYLADLVYARETGRSFTGVRWKFHHFGPWSEEVYKRIEPVVREVQAKEYIISNPRIRDDTVRYEVEEADATILKEAEKKLPLVITLFLKTLVSRFANDTSSLLHFVYTTPPMLTAAPEEELDFSTAQEKLGQAKEDYRSVPKKIPQEELQRLRAEAKRRWELKRRRKKRKRVPADPPPIYDEVFFKGLQELEEMDRETLRLEGEYIAEVSDTVWKSKSRYDPDLA